MMREEFVTKSILGFLKTKGYSIISFDFPQSGTGILLHPDIPQDKNGGIKPDIIASKGRFLLIMENKERYWKDDFEKLHRLKTCVDYTRDLKKLHSQYNTTFLKVGVGIPNNKKTIEKALESGRLVDFIIVVDEHGDCKVIFGKV